MEYIIGLDLGTGSIKTVLFDQFGKEIAQMAQEYPVYQPHNGWSEQEPEDWYPSKKRRTGTPLPAPPCVTSSTPPACQQKKSKALVCLDR